MSSKDIAVVERSAAQVALAGIVRLASGVGPVGGPSGRVVFVESDEHRDFALGLCRGAGDQVFAPSPDGADGVIAYEGGLTRPGDELFAADGLFVYTQDYLATPFLAVAGPSIVRISGQEDYEAFLEDADLAREKGAFVEQLLNPAVFLADQCALGATHPCDRLARLHVSASGEVRTAPGGAVLGTAASTEDDLAVSFERHGRTGDVCLNAVVPPEVLDRARATRPWLSRYLRAIDVLRGLRADGRSAYRVSGFGGRFTEGLTPEPVEPEGAPLVLRGEDEHLVCDPRTGRVFRVGADAAVLVELLLVLGDRDAVSEVAAQRLRVERAAAREAVDAVVGHFGGLGVELVGIAA